MIWWNGVSSDDLGLYVEHYPDRKLPERKTTFYSLPGRTGDYVYQQNAWNNYTQAYDIYISAEQRKLPNAMVAINAWLYSAQGYAKLEDSYDLDTYRMACFVGGQDIENMLNRYGRATIEFNCKPQRWLRSGEEWIDLTGSTGTASNWVSVMHPTGLPASPVVSISATGEVDICAQNYISSTDHISDRLSESLEIYDATGLEKIWCETMSLEYDSTETDDPYSQLDIDSHFNLRFYRGEKVYINYELGTGATLTSLEMMPRWFLL